MMVISTILFPVIAFGLAIGVGVLVQLLWMIYAKIWIYCWCGPHHELKSEVAKSSVA